MKTHRFDPLSFIVGAIALLIGLAFLVPSDPTDVFAVIDDFGAWFWPVTLVLIGAAILAPIARIRVHHDDAEDSEAD